MKIRLSVLAREAAKRNGITVVAGLALVRAAAAELEIVELLLSPKQAAEVERLADRLLVG